MKAVIDGLQLADDVISAVSMTSRMRGLLGRDGLPPKTAMLIDPCGSIHTFGMRFSIDVIFLDRQDRIVKAAMNVKPSRMVFGGWHARKVLEMQAGTLELPQSALGSKVQFSG